MLLLMFQQVWMNGLISGSLYALVALGFSFTFGPTRFFNLAYGAVVLVGAYLAYTFAVLWGWPVWVSVLAAMLSCGTVGWGMDWLVFKPLRRRGASRMIYLVAALGIFTCLQSILALIYGSHFRSFTGKVESHSFHILGGTVTDIQLVIFATVIAATVFLYFFLRVTKYGKAVKAISDQMEAAKVVGIHTDRVLGITFFIGSMLAGMAGVLLGMELGVEPSMGMIFLFKGAIASLVGGLGSLPGAVLGGFLLGFAENFGVWKLQGEWREAIAFGLLIVFLLFRPAGILPRKGMREF